MLGCPGPRESVMSVLTDVGSGSGRTHGSIHSTEITHFQHLMNKYSRDQQNSSPIFVHIEAVLEARVNGWIRLCLWLPKLNRIKN